MAANLTLPLNALDIASDYYVDIAYILREEAAPTLEQVRAGAVYLTRQYPCFAGHIIDANRVEYDPTGVTPVEIHDNGEVKYAVKDYKRGTLQAPGFQEENVNNFHYFASFDESLHKMAWAVCKYTKLADGCFLGVSVHHRVSDARGTALFAQALAYMTRLAIEHAATNTTPTFPLQDLPAHLQIQFDRTPMNELMDLTVPVDKEFPDAFIRKFEELRPMSIFTGLDMTHPAASLTFHFTSEQAKVVKDAAQARATRNGWPFYVSTRDALVGFLFTLHLAATHLYNLDHDIPEDDAKVGLCVAVDTRKHFNLPETFAGNAALIAFARGRVLTEWLSGIGAAAILRRAILKQTPELSQQFAGWLHNAGGLKPLNDPKTKLQMAWTHGPVHGGFGDGCSTDWTRMGWETAHFTPRGEALYKAQPQEQMTDPNAVPSVIVTPPNVMLPGHVKMITDVTRGDDQGFLLQLYTGWQQYLYLKEGGKLHEATKDLEWIGKDFIVDSTIE